MKTTFNIYTDNFDYSAAQLFVEIAPRQISAVVLSESNCFNHLLSYALFSNVYQSVDEIRQILQNPLFSHIYKKIIITWLLPESILTPGPLFKDGYKSEMLSVLFGPGDAPVCKTDFLPQNNIHNTYRVAGDLHAIVVNKFPGCRQGHQFSMLPEIDCGEGQGISLLCIFYNAGFAIQLKNAGQLIFVNYFNYNAPEDVSYYLLSICKNFEADPEKINLVLAGLVEKESVLYRELYKYFVNVSFLIGLQFVQ